MQLGVALQGGKALVANAERIKKKLDAGAQKQCMETAREVKALAQQMVPKRTGETKRTMRVRAAKRRPAAVVQVMTAAGIMQELGTGIRGAAGPKTPLFPNRWDYGEDLGHPAQPYLGPAMESVKEKHFRGFGRFLR